MWPLERRVVPYAAAVFLVALALGSALRAHFVGLELAEHRRAAVDLARSSAFAIEQELSRTLASASALGALVAEGGSDRQLDGLASRLRELHQGSIDLQLARDGVISRLWPLAGNEAALGLDILHHPIHGPFTRRSIEARRPLLYGPFELIQGGASMALRVPIFVQEHGQERFWGLASAILRLEALLERSRVARLADAGYDYEILRVDAGAGRPASLAGSRAGGLASEDPATVEVEVPSQRWTLAVVPKVGWRTTYPPLLAHLAVLLVALLAAVLAYRTLSLPAVLRKEVAARTAELEEAHQEQRRAEEAQRHSQKLEAIGLLAGGVAHDFNNLLAGILGYADLLATEATPGTLPEEAAQAISMAAQRGAQLTRQLLTFARMGRQREEDVDLHEVTREVAALLARTVDKSIRVELRLQAPQHWVRGDSGQLQQVILNLAVNARDAMPSGGTMTLTTDVQDLDEASATRGLTAGRYLVLTVADTGVGIPGDHLDRIFEPFFTTKAEGRGTGLGLATAYGIARSHGGVLRVYSEVGVGTRFRCYLPALSAPGAARAEPVREAPRGSGVVLVVDDEALVRQSAGRILASLGYQAVLVAGGQEALDWLAVQAMPPAAVVLDLSMPGMDGPTCFDRMRARFPGLKVVISSGFDRTGRGQDLLDRGAKGFVQKPYGTGELAVALSEAIRAVA